jgi:hypothetical protein
VVKKQFDLSDANIYKSANKVEAVGPAIGKGRSFCTQLNAGFGLDRK